MAGGRPVAEKSYQHVLFFIYFLLTMLATRATFGQESQSPEQVEAEREQVTIRAVCTAHNPRTVVPVLAQLRSSPRSATSVASALASCVDANDLSSRPVLIISFLEDVRRSDLLHETLIRVPHGRVHLRAQVALANIEGDYGALSLAIGEAMEDGLRESEFRHILGYLLPPRGRPLSEADTYSRRAIRAWLAYFNILNGSPWARADG